MVCSELREQIQDAIHTRSAEDSDREGLRTGMTNLEGVHEERRQGHGASARVTEHMNVEPGMDGGLAEKSDAADIEKAQQTEQWWFDFTGVELDAEGWILPEEYGWIPHWCALRGRKACNT